MAAVLHASATAPLVAAAAASASSSYEQLSTKASLPQSKVFGCRLCVKAAAKRQPFASRFVVKAASPKVDESIGEKISAATEVCKEGTTGECAAAWDEVEELSAEAAHAKARGKTDPLEKFCDDNPEADECRVYED